MKKYLSILIFLTLSLLLEELVIATEVSFRNAMSHLSHSLYAYTEQNDFSTLTQDLKTMLETPSHEGILSLKVDVNKQNLTIGEKFIYTVTLVVPQKLSVLPPESFRDFGDFILLDSVVLPLQQTNEKIIFKTHYTLAFYQTGEATIPETEVIILNQENQGLTANPYKITSPKMTLYIEPLITNGDEIHEPFKGPHAIAGEISLSSKIIFVILIFLVSGSVAYWRRQQSPQTPKAPKPFFQQTQLELRELLKEFANILSMPSPTALQNNTTAPSAKIKQVEKLYDRLSTLARLYLSRKCSSDLFLAYTTTEVQKHLKKDPIIHEKKKYFVTFLKKADWVKFSGKTAPLRSAQTFIKHLENMLTEDACQDPEQKEQKLPKLSKIHPLQTQRKA